MAAKQDEPLPERPDPGLGAFEQKEWSIAPEQDEPLPDRPYPGLRAFEQKEWSIFFGREEHADEVIARLGRHGLVLVHGASGCGKSSLIRAGVLPTLETHYEVAGRTWRTATMRPSEGLLERLAEVLEENLPRPAAADGEPAPVSWSDLIVKGAGLVDYVEDAVQAAGGSFCLLIDQFEEVFRWARERSEAEVRVLVDFLKQVGSAGEKGFYVILTMRSDYFGACAGYDGFAEFLNPRQYLLPRMDEFGLLRAIHEPAELYGGRVDSAVSTLLLPVVKIHLDGLPVLQHALMRASDLARAPGRTMPGEPWVVTAQDLKDVGGADRALAVHAEEVLARATSGAPELIEAAEWIFRALTDLDADRRAIRRPCTLGELIEVAGVDRERTLALIDHFRAPDCTFISPYLPVAIEDGDELDISHEALIRQWPKLCNTEIDSRTSRPKGWVYREFHDGLVWRALAVQAEQFTHNPKHLLSVATTEQRLPWFHAIEKRPGWTERHAVTEQRHDTAAVEAQWNNVKAMMEESERNLKREQGALVRLRVSRNVIFASAIVVLIIAAITVVQYRTWLSQKDAMIKQNAVQFAIMWQMSENMIAGECSQQFAVNTPHFRACREQMRGDVRRDYNERLEAVANGAQPTTADTPLPTFNQGRLE